MPQGGSNAKGGQYDIFFYSITSSYGKYRLPSASVAVRDSRAATFGDGGVGIFGGCTDAEGTTTTNAEYYSGSLNSSFTHTKSTLTSLGQLKNCHQCAEFGDGGVGIFGGQYPGYYGNSCFYYSNTSHVMSQLDKMWQGYDGCAERFGDGSVIVFGGHGFGGNFMPNTGIFANTSHTYSDGTPMSIGRASGANIASRFNDGGIGIFGGWSAGGGIYTDKVDYYSNTSHTISSLSPLSSARGYGPTCRFGDGGCASFSGFKGSAHTTEVDYYANSSHSKTALTPNSYAKTDGGAAMINFGNEKGSVYVIGGTLGGNVKSIERYSNSSHTKTYVTDHNINFAYGTVETFGNGDIIISGGCKSSDGSISTESCFITNRKILPLTDASGNYSNTKYKFSGNSSEVTATSSKILFENADSGYVKLTRQDNITI